MPLPKNMKGWKSMDLAPKDGTEIIILETPNGVHFNTMVACYMALMHDDKQYQWRNKDNTSEASWWGTYPTHWSSNGPYHTHWKPIACTPLCWKPIPKNTFSKKDLHELYRAVYDNE